MRSAPCFNHPSLSDFDAVLKKCLGSIINANLTDVQWTQASLPVCKGGLGIRLVSQLAPSAFLASAIGTKGLQDSILHHCTDFTSGEDYISQALSFWASDPRIVPPIDDAAAVQRN